MKSTARHDLMPSEERLCVQAEVSRVGEEVTVIGSSTSQCPLSEFTVNIGAIAIDLTRTPIQQRALSELSDDTTVSVSAVDQCGHSVFSKIFSFDK